MGLRKSFQPCVFHCKAQVVSLGSTNNLASVLGVNHSTHCNSLLLQMATLHTGTLLGIWILVPKGDPNVTKAK